MKSINKLIIFLVLGNFRPVLTPNRELRMHYGGAGGDYSSGCAGAGPSRGQSPSTLPPQIPQRITSSLVGTMSPPAQPLTKR